MRNHWPLLALLGSAACGNHDMADAPKCGSQVSASLQNGPGAFDPTFETSSSFTTHTSMVALGLPSSPHRKVQIFYSKNIEPVLGAQAFGTLPQGTVAIKKQDRDGDGVIDQLM